MAFRLHQVSLKDNLTDICTQIQPDSWGADNEMTSYQPPFLEQYLNTGGILLLCYAGEEIAGISLAYPLIHPAGDHSLYVHELDTHPKYRRQGVARSMMEELKTITARLGFSELWIAADKENDAANSLYLGLRPNDIDPSVTYTYSVSKPKK